MQVLLSAVRIMFFFVADEEPCTNFLFRGVGKSEAFLPFLSPPFRLGARGVSPSISSLGSTARATASSSLILRSTVAPILFFNLR